MFRKTVKKSRIALLLVTLSLANCTSVPITFNELLRERIEGARSDGQLTVQGEKIAALNLIATLYENNGFQPLWQEPGMSYQLLDAVHNAREDGLNPTDYHYEALSRMLSEPDDSSSDKIGLELLLSDAFFRLAYHYQFGRTEPEKLFITWNFTRNIGQTDPHDLLKQAIDAGRIKKALNNLLPQNQHYQGLKHWLARYRNLAANGGWPALPDDLRLEPGMNHPYVVLLRNRLQVIGYYSGAKSGQDSEFYNSELVLSVLDFQRRHGIEPDGVVGAETLAALNVPIEERIDQIRVNMERLRWVSQSLRNDYLLVDIAGFSVTLYQDGQLTWKTRAIVGRPYRRTPVFRASMTYMVLNPNWTVPRTILHEDILPKVKRDPAALIEKNLLVIDPLGQEVDPNKIDWDKFPASYRGYKLRQPPGPDNTLGRIKFMFPNPYVVYLHDTSSKLLFNETQRAFSSGCIRIENPLELAEILLESNTDYKREWLYEQIETQQTRTVQLNRALPVLMLYFTAEAHDGEFIQFRNDLYGRDDKVLKALTDKMSFTLGIVDSRSNHNISRKP